MGRRAGNRGELMSRVRRLLDEEEELGMADTRRLQRVGPTRPERGEGFQKGPSPKNSEEGEWES